MPAHTRLEAQTGGLRLLAAPRPWPVPVGQHVALDILLCAAPGSPLPQGLQVDAEMPAHRHGMNYRATVRPLGGGRFVAEGLLFHMPGRWRLLFDVGDARQPLRLATDLTIE